MDLVLSCLGVGSSLPGYPKCMLIAYFRMHTKLDGNPETESEESNHFLRRERR